MCRGETWGESDIGAEPQIINTASFQPTNQYTFKCRTDVSHAMRLYHLCVLQRLEIFGAGQTSIGLRTAWVRNILGLVLGQKDQDKMHVKIVYIP